MVFNRSEARSQKNRQLSSCACTRISNKTRLIGPRLIEAVMNDGPLARLRSEYLKGLREYNRTAGSRDDRICV